MCNSKAEHEWEERICVSQNNKVHFPLQKQWRAALVRTNFFLKSDFKTWECPTYILIYGGDDAFSVVSSKGGSG